MDVKSANPFLFAEDDYTSPSAAPSNPFLMAEDDFPDNFSGNDNPFLSQTAASVASAGGTNPFAFDGMDMGPAEAAPAFDIATTFQNTFMTNAYTDTAAILPQSEVNFFAEPASIQTFYPQPSNNHPFLIDTEMPTALPQKPTELDLRYTNTVATEDEILTERNGGTARPPPPRPPPSKETQDLLMTVMGAMDATSSHLLDRIPPTRTPSPVSMRDLHSPSPTPEPQFVNLLDVSDVKSQLVDTSQSVNLFDDDLMGQMACDINKNHQEQTIEDIPTMAPIIATVPNISPVPIQSAVPSIFNMQPMAAVPVVASQQAHFTNISNLPLATNTTSVPPIVPQVALVPTSAPVPEAAPARHAPPVRPGPPIRPPRPAPPMKPPPPVTANAPPKPPPPVVKPVIDTPPPSPVPPAVATVEPVDEMMEMFGSQQQVAKSKADILNLYRKPEIPLDLLCDGMDAAPSSVEAIDGSASGSNSRKSSVPSRKSSIPSRKSSIPSIDNSNIAAIPSVGVNIIEPVDMGKSPSPAPENYLSSEPSQADLQMDTSDSQSKGSVSSVTMNPFAANDEITSPAVSDIQPTYDVTPKLDNNVFHEDTIVTENFPPSPHIFGTSPAIETIQNEADSFPVSPPEPISDLPKPPARSAVGKRYGFSSNKTDSFDAFTAKFESAKDENKNGAFPPTDDTWGNSAFDCSAANAFHEDGGFGADDTFDAFLALQEPPSVPQSTPSRMNRAGSLDSDEDKDFSVVIKPKMNNEGFGDSALPILAPPPVTIHSAFPDISPRNNPFDNSGFVESAVQYQEPIVLPPFPDSEAKCSDGEESPGTPLFDEDVSQPLQPFPRLDFAAEGWEMHLRQPNKKKITGQRFWKKIFIRISFQADCVLLQLFNQQTDKDPFQELPLQPCYSVSDISAQQYDNYGKIFTVKLQYIFYKERPGVRPGQVKKAERITNKLSQFAAYAIQGDYQGVKEFGSDLKKLGLPVEHAPQISQLMKIGSLNFEDLKQFSVSIEEALFKLQAHRDRALHYKMEEVQVTCVDELYVHQSSEGHIEKQVARVRLFFLGFLTGMPNIELGVNDMRRQGKEVVGRHDIIPVVTEEWIRLEAVEFHSCIQQNEYNDTHIIKFKPPDACYIELLRFRVRPPKNRELPLQLKCTICINGTKVELRADILVPGFASRKLGQVPCEDVMVRFPIPECWIYLFRVEKHFRYGSVKSAHRRTGKIKGIERILGTVDTLQESLIEVTSGQAKYEHQHRAIVWRCPRLPKEGQGAYTTHNFVCRLALTSFDQIPDQLAEYCYVEFTMPATQASHTTVRSVSIQNSDSDEPPEKFVRHLARHEYRVGIEHIEAEGPNAYISATMTKPKPPPPPPPPEEKPKSIPEAESSSDSD